MTGRKATTIVEVGDLALSVGKPTKKPNKDWTWAHLNSMAEMATGHTPSRRRPEYWGGDIKWMCARDARWRHGGVIYETKETINQLGLDNSAAVVLPKDTVCLSRTGASIGYIVRLGEPMATNQGFVNWICGEELCSKYLQYLFFAEEAFLKRIGYGAAHPTIYFTQVKAFHIQVPPLSEQKRIVSILDEAFGAIAKAKENAARNLANAHELFDSYLNRVFIEKGEGWEERHLADLCVDDRVITYGVIKLGDTVPDGVPCLRTSNVKRLQINLAGMKRIDPSLSESFGRTILQGGEVLVNVRGTLGGVAVVPDKMVGWNVSREVAVVPLDICSVDPSFVALWIAAKKQQDWLTGVKKGAAYTGINIEDLRRLPVCYPSRSEQKGIVRSLESAKESCWRLGIVCQQKLDVLDELKQSLLQKAFTGQLTTKSKELELV